jgi:tryptophanyl-tRNA synthetase
MAPSTRHQPTILSGIQPSGRPHLGNYFGALRHHIAATAEPGEHFYFIADYHALTSSRDPEALRANVADVAATYLALGLDPERAVLWRQSDVPEVTEIAWLLACVTGMGLLERAHSYKEKTGHGLKPNVGLFTYPILMAADILAFDADWVPVGRDQVQHLEMAQDMAGYFNGAFGEVFKRPEARLPVNEREAKVPGLDGQKMSKSYGNDIWIFAEGKELKQRINQVVTDSRPPEEAKDPSGLVLYELLALFLSPDEQADWAERLRRGGPGAPGYGQLKARLTEGIEAAFGPARERRRQLLSDPAELNRLLARGAERARVRATSVRDRALRACGLR